MKRAMEKIASGYRGRGTWFAALAIALGGVEQSPGAVDAGESFLQPVRAWNFEGPGEAKAWREASVAVVPGPRAPEYPLFDATNHAIRITNDTTSRREPSTKEAEFKRGEPLTLQGWLRAEAIAAGQLVNLLSSIAGSSGDGAMDYRFLLSGGQDNGTMRIGLCIRSTTSDQQEKSTKWRQWWSEPLKLKPAEWQHVTFTHTFGNDESIRAYLNGKRVTGAWEKTDTSLPLDPNPGVSIGGTADPAGGGTFAVEVDRLSIYRNALDAGTVSYAYDRVSTTAPTVGVEVAADKVRIEIMASSSLVSREWPAQVIPVGEVYDETAFGFFELPQHYIATGVRADRADAILVRASAKVEIPPGKHRLLLRARGTARLFINGRLILSTPKPLPYITAKGATAAQDNYLDLGPDFRFAPPGNRETWCYFESDGASVPVIMETIIGGKQGGDFFRPELGETVVAWSREGADTWALLSPVGRQVPYTDAGWAAYEAERRMFLAQMDRTRRKQKREEHGDYWRKRREIAAEWLASTPAVSVPSLPAGYPAHNEIDHFIAKKVTEVAGSYQGAGAGGVDFFRQIQPILEGRCYDCHQGSKTKGELWLDSLAGARKGGAADGPAIVPGAPAQSAMMLRVRSQDEEEVMPPKGDRLTAAEIALLEKWIGEGAHWPELKVSTLELPPLVDDLTFLRRVSIDTIGVFPTETEIRTFLNDDPARRREAAIERLLSDARWADNWVGYWQDVLAENPNILNPTLNNTGPFRWWLHESLVDDKPMDLMVTELIRMEGSRRYGGPAGFAVASQNDAPFAEKAAIIGAAFLGVEMKCARCHDAPNHVSKQENLFQLAAMLNQNPVTVPATSSVPMDRLHEGGRKALIQVTLPPGSKVEPAWPFAALCDEQVAKRMAADPNNTRDQLAALVTAPQNERFAQVMVNRIWERLMGRGIVATVHDWEKGSPTHPELLHWLARDFVRSGYRLTSVARKIFQSHAYQRQRAPGIREPEPLYVAVGPRRMTAEQLVDALFHATGKPFNVEEASVDIDSMRGSNVGITLGKPRRAWMLTSTSNDRDRPTLALPRMQAVTEVMEAFGWRGERQSPLTQREDAPNVAQPAILANGTMARWLTTLSGDHALAGLAQEDQSLSTLVDRLYLRLLTRAPSPPERVEAEALLKPGYETRNGTDAPSHPAVVGKRTRPKYVSWSNHVDPPATHVALEAETRARRGDPPVAGLRAEWRERLEDFVWGIINSPEMILIR